jgi:16S rRNA C1402 (ribose-2'-O) methylase RsmI
MNKITSADVSAWLKEQLTALHETYDYAHIEASVHQFRTSTSKAEPLFSIYTGDGTPGSRDKKSLEDCIADMATQTPQSRAELKRQKAAQLLAEAEEIEAQTQTKP